MDRDDFGGGGKGAPQALSRPGGGVSAGRGGAGRGRRGRRPLPRSTPALAPEGRGTVRSASPPPRTRTTRALPELRPSRRAAQAAARRASSRGPGVQRGPRRGPAPRPGRMRPGAARELSRAPAPAPPGPGLQSRSHRPAPERHDFQAAFRLDSLQVRGRRAGAPTTPDSGRKLAGDTRPGRRAPLPSPPIPALGRGLESLVFPPSTLRAPADCSRLPRSTRLSARVAGRGLCGPCWVRQHHVAAWGRSPHCSEPPPRPRTPVTRLCRVRAHAHTSARMHPQDVPALGQRRSCWSVHTLKAWIREDSYSEPSGHMDMHSYILHTRILGLTKIHACISMHVHLLYLENN